MRPWQLDRALLSKARRNHDSLVERIVARNARLVPPPVGLGEHFFNVLKVVQENLPVVWEFVLASFPREDDGVFERIAQRFEFVSVVPRR